MKVFICKDIAALRAALMEHSGWPIHNLFQCAVSDEFVLVLRKVG